MVNRSYGSGLVNVTDIGSTNDNALICRAE